MIYIAGDHHAEPTLARIRSFLTAEGQAFKEFGFEAGKNPSARLEDFIPQLAEAVRGDAASSGILVCGTGVGVEVGANRFPGIRASLCASSKYAEWARAFDAANVLCLAAWAIQEMDVEAILKTWFNTPYDGNENRMKMLAVFDSWPDTEPRSGSKLNP